jgi:hypothetical protein
MTLEDKEKERKKLGEFWWWWWVGVCGNGAYAIEVRT